MLDAQRLQVLAEVARAGSIASAARRLAFTPSAVSQQIGKLERDLGCEVLHRHPRGVRLTPVGQALVSHAEAVTGELRAAEQTVQAMLGTQPRRLAVGAFASAGQSLVPGALARFRRHHPDVALSLTDLEPPAPMNATRVIGIGEAAVVFAALAGHKAGQCHREIASRPVCW